MLRSVSGLVPLSHVLPLRSSPLILLLVAFVVHNTELGADQTMPNQVAFQMSGGILGDVNLVLGSLVPILHGNLGW